MSVLMTLEIPGGTTAMYDRANTILGIAAEGDAPTGLITHVCAVTDDGIVIVDVWDSVRSLDDFARDRLATAFAQVGMPEATPHVTTVHKLVFGAGKEANVLTILEVSGFTIEAYDALVEKMPSHVDPATNHPAVMHVATNEPDGIFRAVGLWDSEDVYRTFVQSELAPAIDRARHFVLRLWPVYKRLQPVADATS
jgi:hypothetical protein